MEKKLLMFTVFVATVFVVITLHAGLVAAQAGANNSNANISVQFGNNSVISTNLGKTILLNWSVNNATTLAGANITYIIDGRPNGVGVLACNGTMLTNGTPTASSTTMVGGVNGSGCSADGVVNQLHLNLTEGQHTITFNITFGQQNYTSSGNISGINNETFHVLNFDSLAFAGNNTGNGGNVSLATFTVYTQFNSSMVANITFELWNFTSGRMGRWDHATNLTNYTGPSLALQAMLNGSNFTFINQSYAVVKGSTFNYNVTIYYNVTDLNQSGTDTYFTKRIYRQITTDLLAPNVSLNTDSCTGWYDKGNAHVERDTTFTCTCSTTDENDTQATATATSIDTTTLGLKGVACNGNDAAGNNATSSTVSYQVIELDGGSAGGGGGGGSAATASTITGSTYVVNEQQLSEGTSASLKAGDGFKATFKSSGQASSGDHTVKVSEVSASSAIIVISSDPITFKLNTGDSKKVDIDADGIYDVEVTLTSVTSGKADIKIMETTGTVPAGEGPVSGGTGLEAPETPETPEDKGGVSKIVWIIIAVVAIIIIAAVVIGMKKKK